MSIIFIDTETTGRNPRTARLVQLAVYRTDPTPPFAFQAELNCIIQPDGFMIPLEAARIHGIDTDTAFHRGIPLPEALDRLEAHVAQADRIVAHNFSYDNTVLMSEYDRLGLDLTGLTSLRPFCTMTSLTERCRLPGKYPGKFKWPTLLEAYRHCFGDDPPPGNDRRAHEAMSDTLYCYDIFRHGVAQGWWR